MRCVGEARAAKVNGENIGLGKNSGQFHSLVPRTRASIQDFYFFVPERPLDGFAVNGFGMTIPARIGKRFILIPHFSRDFIFYPGQAFNFFTDILLL